MGNALAQRTEAGPDLEALLIGGDLGRLSADQRITYYRAVCESVGLNPLTQPFEYLVLSGKLRLYARKDCTDQLRKIHGVSVAEMSDQMLDGVYVVTCTVCDKTGRTDIAKGAVSVKGLAGEALANALMKTETKAKRRATLSICGLGMLDETEVEDRPGVPPPPPPAPLYTPPKAPAAPPPPPPKSAPSTAPAAAAATAPAAVTTTPAASTDETPPMIDSPQRVDQVALIRRLMIEAQPAGLGWHPKHAEAWLQKYFGVAKPIKLALGQARDAELLLRARLKEDVEELSRLLEMFHSEGRVLCAEVGES